MTVFLFLALSIGPAASFQGLSSPESPRQVLFTQVRKMMHSGRYEEAKKRLTSAPETDPYAIRLSLELSQREGRTREATAHARRLLQFYELGQLRSSDGIGHAAYAAGWLDLWKEANELFIEAAAFNPVSVSLFVDWGNLYLERYNPTEAESIFQDGLKASPGNPGMSRWGFDHAYLGLARALDDQFKPGSRKALKKALELNPHNLDALAFGAFLAIEKEDWEEALSWIEKGLRINKNHLPLLELKTTFHYFRKERQDYRKTREHVLKINPDNADLFETLGRMSVGKRRLEEAVEFYRESVQRNPRQWSALSSLGINLLRLGKEEEGKQALEQAYANDPFNIWTVNTLRLLDSFDRFLRFETPHFSVKLHQKEAEALQPYVEELLERSLRKLEQKYGHDVIGKYLFEMYPDHEDFAVRTLGLPGLGALGATFGRVVAMDSPSARPKGQFHWGSTLWHEVAHLLSSSLSNQKVPRWLSEGISMMEERQAGEGWGDHIGLSFINAYKQDQLLSLADLNSGFERPQSPQQLEISYYQAGWICEFLAFRYGLDKIRHLLVAFGQEKTTEDVFQEVFGFSVQEVDRQFREEMSRTLKALLPRLETLSPISTRPVESEGKEPEKEWEVLKRQLQKNPENYFLNLRMGKTLKTAGLNQEAIPYLEKAQHLFPHATGKGSPYHLLAEIYEETGDIDKTIRALRRWWKATPRFAENALKLAGLLFDRNQFQEASRYLEEAMYVDPLAPDYHELLGDLYLRSDRPHKAVREFRVLLSLQPPDVAGARFRLAEALYASGDEEAARREVLMSLEIAPGYEEAQKLLLKLVRK